MGNLSFKSCSLGAIISFGGSIQPGCPCQEKIDSWLATLCTTFIFNLHQGDIGHVLGQMANEKRVTMEITALLYWKIELIHKGIDINQRNNHNYKAFWHCCGILRQRRSWSHRGQLKQRACAFKKADVSQRTACLIIWAPGQSLDLELKCRKLLFRVASVHLNQTNSDSD